MLAIEEFERRAREGEIAPHHEICFPAVTGATFVPAGTLELYRGLYTSGLITFRRHFHLARMPYVTLLVIGLLCLTYFVWQKGPPDSTEELIRLGAKCPPLMVELDQWWRLATANLLHVSGWHLLVNVIFLFNLGGPTEAAYRRSDYVLILAVSAIGTTSLSAVANPTTSCGASGIVFGVWGAAAVFGMQHRSLLPDRYRRYFIGSVIPYSVFALYLGFAFPGVDNWGHLGGLVAGSSTALFLPARLLVPMDRLAWIKLVAVAGLALLLASSALWRPDPAPLSLDRYFPRHGLSVPIPSRWSLVVSSHDRAGESLAFENGAGVTVGIQTRLAPRWIRSPDLGREFVDRELAHQLESAGALGLRIADPVVVRLAGRHAHRIQVEVLTPGFTARATFWVFARGYFHYVVSLTAPQWLADQYQPTFTRILNNIHLGDTDELTVARKHVRDNSTPASWCELATAQAHMGRWTEAVATLAEARRRWPDQPPIPKTIARLQAETNQTIPLSQPSPEPQP